MTRQDLIIFGDSHIGPIMHVRDRMPDIFPATLLPRADLCWVDYGMMAYSFTNKSSDNEGCNQSYPADVFRKVWYI